MSEYRSHQIRLANIPEGKCYCRNTTKSFRTLVFVAIVLLGVFSGIEEKAYAIPFFMYFLFLIFRPEELVLSMYDRFMVFYSEEKENYQIIYYSEIEHWSYHIRLLVSSVELQLESGERISISKGLNVLTYYVFKHHLKSKKEQEKKEKTIS